MFKGRIDKTFQNSRIRHLIFYNINYIGRKLSTPPNLLKSSQFSRTSSSICLINNNNNPVPTPNPSTPSSKSSLSVQHQLRRSVSSSSLTKIAALNRMQLLQQRTEQQQRNNNLNATSRINSGSSTNLTGSLFNNSLEVAHEEGRLEIGQSFGSASTNAMRT